MIGERIGNFNVVSQLGRGGMGEVYLGEHEKIGTRVAVKVLQPHISSNKDHVERFFNEAIAVSKIQHSGIGKIFDVGFHAERAYLVMEFLAGETLATRIRRLGKLSLAHVCELGRQICGVLEAVHKAGITHRDLKPDNIFIVPDDELPGGERVKIVDFGIAKLSGAGPGLTATNSGSMGTPAYMSPEQWKNSKAVDWRADAYSLGCLTFEMIAGRPPFIAETIGEACSLHLTEPAPQLGSLVAIPAALDALIASLLAKLPEQRPPSMRDIANAFAALGQGIGLGADDTLSTPAMALGATMPSTPPQVAPNMGTQATGAGNAAMQPTMLASQLPQVAPPSMPPPISTTTLGGAAGSQVQPVAKRADKRGLIWALAGAVAALIVVVIVLAIPKGEEHAGVEFQVVEIPDDRKGSAFGSGSGSAPDVRSESGSGFGSAIVDATANIGKDTGSAVNTMMKRPKAGSGSGRQTRVVKGADGPRVGETKNVDPGVLPKHTLDVGKAVQLQYPRLVACGNQHDAHGIQVNYVLHTNPDGTFGHITYVATRDHKAATMSGALVKCLTDVFKSLTYGRSTDGGRTGNGFLLR